MSLPTHVAIIMDGNGRWAKAKNKPRTYGHKIGAQNIKKIVNAAIKNKIKYLTLFAFSCENWDRPQSEVTFLIKLFNRRLDNELINYLNQNNIIFKWIGFKDKLSINLVNKLRKIEKVTKENNGLILTIVFNYGGKQDILQAAKITRSSTTLNNFKNLLLTKNTPDIDLLIRTGGDKRISNFLLWQSAYAEIIFEPTYWPAYNEKHFANNILEYCSRQRRFGKI